MHSCFYSGIIRHQRSKPVNHGFRYPLFLAYLDLAELEPAHEKCSLLKRRFGPANFRASDHAVALENEPNTPLDETVRELVTQRTGERPRGPIRLLTLLRNWGYYFSPLNLYFCFDSSENAHALQTVVAEVSNTPWRQTNYYVLNDFTASKQLQSQQTATLTTTHAKTFHVSPFMDMDSRYEWHLSAPNESLELKLISHNPKHPFVADMRLERRPLTNKSLTKLLVRHPCMTSQITARIYYQALKLWWKRCPFYSHPKHKAATMDGQFKTT